MALTYSRSRVRYTAPHVANTCDEYCTLQNTTFGLSISVQLVALGLSISALSQNESPVLGLILWLEVSVGATEATWYAVVGTYFIGRGSVQLAWRYLDWFITTPIMLISVAFFTIWDANPECTSPRDLVARGERVAAIPTVIFFDWLMLLVGLAYETREVVNLQNAHVSHISGRKRCVQIRVLLENLCQAADRLVGGERGRGIWLGFVPFALAFMPLAVLSGVNYTERGVIATVVTFATWSLYGVVAVWVSSPHLKNTCYNLLDIASKNVVGIVIAAIALNESSATGRQTNTTNC